MSIQPADEPVLKVNAKGHNLLHSLIYLRQVVMTRDWGQIGKYIESCNEAIIRGNRVEICNVNHEDPNVELLLAGLKKDWREFRRLVKLHEFDKDFIRSVLVSTRMVYGDTDLSMIIEPELGSYEYSGDFLLFKPRNRYITTCVTHSRMVNGKEFRYVFVSSSIQFVSTQDENGDITIRLRSVYSANTEEAPIQETWISIVRALMPDLPWIKHVKTPRGKLMEPCRFTISEDPARRSFYPRLARIRRPVDITWKVALHDYIYGTSLVDYILLKKQLTSQECDS